MKKKLIVLSGFVLGLAPFWALAQDFTAGCGNTVSGQEGEFSLVSVVCKLNQIVGTVVPFLIALAVAYFIWGVISYVIGSDEEAKKKGRDKMIWGLIGLAAIVAVWGLVKILTTTFGVGGATEVVTPSLPDLGQ
ncbi:MAG TPA: pilin [Candidatus Paceibacterota bacterium]|nr:pilin [Candidatus Paceibacterota bacterium]